MFSRSLLLLLVAAPAWAGLQFTTETTDYVPLRHRAVLEPALQFAMREVREHGPPRDNPFRARQNRHVHVVLTYSNDPTPFQLWGVPSGDSDAFTITAGIGEPQELVTFVFVMGDRIAFDETTGAQRKDAYLRMLAALGHEVYGNVADQLSLKVGEIPIATEASTRRDEIKAFTAGVAFLERYRASDAANAHDPAMLAAILEREKHLLDGWVHPKCDNELNRRRPKKRKKN